MSIGGPTGFGSREQETIVLSCALCVSPGCCVLFFYCWRSAAGTYQLPISASHVSVCFPSASGDQRLMAIRSRSLPPSLATASGARHVHTSSCCCCLCCCAPNEADVLTGRNGVGVEGRDNQEVALSPCMQKRSHNGKHTRAAEHCREPSARFSSTTLGAHDMSIGGDCLAARCRADGSRCDFVLSPARCGCVMLLGCECDRNNNLTLLFEFAGRTSL